MFLRKKNFFKSARASAGGAFLGWRIASILTVGAMLGSALFSTWFIYSNIYTTISNSASIILLGTTPPTDAIDINALSAAQVNLTLKSARTEWPKKLRNIFNYADTAPTSTTSTIYEKK